MLAFQYIFVALILTKWFSILREPGELLSFYNRMLISWDYDYVEFRNEGLMLFMWDLYVNSKPFIHKVLT